jgi:starch synthase
MNVLFVSAEVDPFAKVGGLADVVGSLPAALRRQGADARVLMPLYGTINVDKFGIEYQFSFQMFRRTGTADCHLFRAIHDGVPIYFLKAWPYFGEETSVYTDWDWDSPRFVFFSQAVIAACDALRQRENWAVDLVHANDWHTGIVPFLVSQERWRQEWAHVGTMFTIHNMAYQGDNLGGWMWDAGVPARDHGELLARGLTDNAMAIAIAYSDIITTVSPRYAIEIQYPYMGFGLDDLLRWRVNDLHGIVNGIDTGLWNPETDPQLVSHYNAQNFAERRPPNKRALQAEVGLPERDDVMLIGVVSRLVFQKGFDLAFPALRGILAGQDVQFVGLGSGEPELNAELGRIGQDFPSKARTFVGYNAAVAQHIYAGCDLFLMPSRFEPCGVGQMLAMRYGALPLVRETGGLADTVQNYDNGDGSVGTGFVFNWEQSEAVYFTMTWALDTFRDKPQAWKAMQRNAMLTDSSWTASVQKYTALYENALARWR